MWEVLGHTVEGACRWERATWTFGENTVASSLDALCSDEAGHHAGCTTTAVSPAGFDTATGRWMVERPIAVRSESTSVINEAEADPHAPPDLPASACAATLDAGPYAFTKVRGEDWKYTMTTPGGASVRLKVPNSEHPDYVAALKTDPPTDPRAERPAATTSVWGAFRLDKVTEAGTTEEFRKKMERAARALDRGCIVTDAVYDFRSPTGELPPTTLAYTEVRACDEGGVGTFRNAVTATVPVEWVTNEGGALVVVPPITAEAGLVRIQTEEGSGRTPAQWIADEIVVTPEGDTFLVALGASKGRKPGPPTTIQLTAVDGKALHLVPAP
jgi:hypothetical protein